MVVPALFVPFGFRDPSVVEAKFSGTPYTGSTQSREVAFS